MKKSIIFLLLVASISFSLGAKVSALEPSQPTYIYPEVVDGPLKSSLFNKVPLFPSYTDYNCYGYAIGTYVDESPGYLSNDPWYAGDSLSGLILRVENDLEDLGYYNIRQVNSSYRPTDDSEHLIAFRIGYIVDYEDELGYGGYYDFHFMVYQDNWNVWAHKPGHTKVLVLQNNLFVTDSWELEYYKNGLWYRHPISKYNGTIVFLAYEEYSGPIVPPPLFE